MVHPDLEKWFDRLHQDFGERIPSPSKTNKVVHAVLSKFNTGIKQYLGAGDNGIAFLANDGDVIKFTIDRNEAALWQRLKGQQQKGIITLKNVSNISSSQTGPTLIYVVKAEYAPYPVTDEQAELIRNAKNAATDKIRAYFKTNRRTPEIYHRRRAIELVKQFEIVAASDDAFEKIPDMISDIADKFGGYI